MVKFNQKLAELNLNLVEFNLKLVEFNLKEIDTIRYNTITTLKSESSSEFVGFRFLIVNNLIRGP